MQKLIVHGGKRLRGKVNASGSKNSSLPILAAQRVDAQALARDAERRGWIDEAERHQRLIAQLDMLINQANTG